MNLLDIPEEIQDDLRVAIELQDFERAVELVAIAARVAKPRSHFELLVDLAEYGIAKTEWRADITAVINSLKGDLNDMVEANNFRGIASLARELESLVLQSENGHIRLCLTTIASRMGEQQFAMWAECRLDARDR